MSWVNTCDCTHVRDARTHMYPRYQTPVCASLHTMPVRLAQAHPCTRVCGHACVHAIGMRPYVCVHMKSRFQTFLRGHSRAHTCVFVYTEGLCPRDGLPAVAASSRHARASSNGPRGCGLGLSGNRPSLRGMLRSLTSPASGRGSGPPRSQHRCRRAGELRQDDGRCRGEDTARS